MNTPWPILRFLSDEQEILRCGEKLPHWQQENSTYFVTFRLDDSIPAEVLADWKTERIIWLEDHPKPWSEDIEKEYHQHFSARVDRYLDRGHGSCLLRDSELSAIVAKSFLRFDQERYLLHSFVIMPNHVHLLFSIREDADLSELISSWKRFTATKINRLQETKGALWQRDYFDRIIRNWDHFIAVARYIRRNPVKAKLFPGQFHLHAAPWVEKLLS